MKKSIFIITLVFTLLLSCSGGGLVAYADDYYDISLYVTELGTFDYDLPENSYQILFYYDDVNYGGYYFLVFNDYVSYIDVSSSTGEYILKHPNDTSSYFKYWLIDGVWTLQSSFGNGSCCTTITASNFDIYYGNELFFLQTPRPLVLGMEEKMLVQVITQENPLKEVLILLPMVMVCLVGYVALRKALRTLETILKTA